MSKLAEVVSLIEEAKKLYEKSITDALEPGLKYIAETYGEELELITILGYTPSFNDGEPCYHTTSHMCGYSALEDYGLEHLLEEWFGEEKAEELLNGIRATTPKEVSKFVSTVLSKVYEEKLHTNFIVHIFFKDGNYTIKEDEYDCGH